MNAKARMLLPTSWRPGKIDAFHDEPNRVRRSDLRFARCFLDGIGSAAASEKRSASNAAALFIDGLLVQRLSSLSFGSFKLA